MGAYFGNTDSSKIFPISTFPSNSVSSTEYKNAVFNNKYTTLTTNVPTISE